MIEVHKDIHKMQYIVTIGCDDIRRAMLTLGNYNDLIRQISKLIYEEVRK